MCEVILHNVELSLFNSVKTLLLFNSVNSVHTKQFYKDSVM